MIESIARQCYRCNYCGLFQCGGRHGAENYTLSFDGARYGALLEEHAAALTADLAAARAWAAAWKKACIWWREWLLDYEGKGWLSDRYRYYSSLRRTTSRARRAAEAMERR